MERDARRALIHSGTDRRVAHPARQFAQSPWLVLDQNDVETPAACTFTQAKPPTELHRPLENERDDRAKVNGPSGSMNSRPA